MAAGIAPPAPAHPDSDARDRAFCREALPAVSRTFALTIRLLPPKLEYPVTVAYLLCRIADTIEDTTHLPPDEKRRLLAHFRACLDEPGPGTEPLRAAFAGLPGDEESLAANADRVLREFRRLPEAQRAAVRPWVQEMCAGMAQFVGVATLGSVDDLDRYCYFVAGTVGHMLTELFRLHDGRLTPERYEALESLATSFGLGLQLTNIIKDVADDRRRGLSFIPRELTEAGVGEAREVLQRLVSKAKRHLRDALDYCTRLPRRAYRIRLFCLTSLYFAARTLRLADRRPGLLGTEQKLKITRGAVYRTVAMTLLIAPYNRLVRAYYSQLSEAAL